MEVNTFKVVLEVLLKDLNKPSCKNKRDLKNVSNLKKHVNGNGIDIKKLESGVNKLISDFDEENIKEDCTKNIIFEYLLIVLSNTTQSQRFRDLHNILEHFYNKLVQRWLELGQTASIITNKKFRQVVRKLIPFVKLSVLSDQLTLSANNEGNFLQLYEVILYPNIAREDCDEIVRNKLGTTNIDFIDFQVKQENERYGFMADYYRIKINVKENGEQNTHHLFLKCLPLLTDQIREISLKTVFKKEEIFYSEFIPFLRKLGIDEVLDFLPNCYYSSENCMIYDDIAVEYYSNLDIHTTLSYEQLSSVFKQLAKFNSTGILFEEKLSNLSGKPIFLNEYFKDMVLENLVNKEQGFGELLNCSLRTIYHIINKFPELLQNCNLDKFKQQISDTFEDYFEKVKPSKTGRNFLCHGDFYMNNVLFKNNCVDCLLLDYQTLRYSSPTLDIQFFLYLHTDKQTRDKYGTELLNEYYSNLKQNVAKYGLDICQIYPYETYQLSLTEVNPLAMELALNYMQLILLPKETKQIFEDPIIFQKFLTEDRTNFIDKYWNSMDVIRLKDVLEELYMSLNKN